MERHLARSGPLGSRLEEPSLSQALDRARQAGQRVVADELRLLLLEVRESLTAALSLAGWLGLGVSCLALAWLGFLAAAVLALEGRLTLEARIAGAAGVQLVLGLALLGWAVRRRRKPQ